MTVLTEAALSCLRFFDPHLEISLRKFLESSLRFVSDRDVERT